MADEDRGIDVAAVEKLLRQRFGGEWISQAWEGAEEPGATVFAQFKPDVYGRKVLTGLLLTGSVITADSLRTIPVSSLERAMGDVDSGGAGEDRLREELAQLPTPGHEGRRRIDFLTVVAAHFKVWAKHTPFPATEMAKEWNVNRATMASWIRNARLSGLLPPAKRGKASDPAAIAFQQDLDRIMTMAPSPEREAALTDLYDRHSEEGRS
jgi:hypothetical protein